MAVTTNDFYNGMVIVWKGELYRIEWFQHIKPGKGQAFVKARLRNLTKGHVLEHNFPAAEPIETARVERRPAQFLYADEGGYHFLDNESFEEYILQQEQVYGREFITEGQQVTIYYYADEGTPLFCEPPPIVEIEVEYTEPGVKGDTATTSTKIARLSTGAQVRVPLFVETGEKILVDTRTGEYVGRANEKS